MTGTDGAGTQPADETEGGLTQHGAEDVSEDWDVGATHPRPTGAGAGETPEARAQGSGGRDGNLAESARFHGEQDASPEAEPEG